jgi:hypothetical protein
MRLASILLFVAVLLVSAGVAAADSTRVLVDIGPIDDEVSRVTAARLSAELTAGGFELTRAEETADVRATLVARDGRLVLYLELPNGATMLVRADDVPPSEAPAVLALRGVERLRAGLSAPKIVTPTPTVPVYVPPKRKNAVTPGFFARRHVVVGGVLSIDGGAVSVAPTIGLGIGIGRGFFLRGSLWGPSTTTMIESPKGRATVFTLGGRLDLGVSFPLRLGTALGGSAGLGVGRYGIEGEASPGFSARSAAQPVFLTALDVFVVQRIAGPFYVDVDVGAQISWPSVVVQIGGRDAAERGLLDFRGRIGFGVVF